MSSFGNRPVSGCCRSCHMSCYRRHGGCSTLTAAPPWNRNLFKQKHLSILQHSGAGASQQLQETCSVRAKRTPNPGQSANGNAQQLRDTQSQQQRQLTHHHTQAFMTTNHMCNQQPLIVEGWPHGTSPPSSYKATRPQQSGCLSILNVVGWVPSDVQE